MSQISRLLRDVEGNGLLYWCPGCEMAHRVTHGEGAEPRWGWNGSVDKPTFTPSVLVTWPDPDTPGTNVRVCHTFVTDGHIQFLADCTHALAGQTVDMPELPKWMQD